ncbi:CvfB family protein [Marinicrinis sediminis]|uniref:S1 RNA-binding domain-containing protein n=1 Tax=Marinicrinis sediminis TaxID=1652465 RepID=A0ABW5R999_9BACL
MRLEAGTYHTLTVEREVSPNGYYLGNEEEEVLLHYSEIEGSIELDDELEVFLFMDTKDRLAATMKKPFLALGETAKLEVVEIHPRLGMFLDMGLSRHLLLPYRQLPEEEEFRPHTGDWVFVQMSQDKQGRLIARMAGEEELSSLAFPAPAAWKHTRRQATVYKTLKMGSFVICEGEPVGFGVIGLIHEDERTRPLRVGETLEVRITHVREDGRVNASMREAKEVSRNVDAESLLAFLESRPNGSMPYSDETPADIILSRFQISKAAFKRAIGKLMKEGKVRQEGSWTYLIREEE